MYTKYVGCLLACSLAAASSAAMEEVYYAGVNIALVDYEIDTIADSGSLGLAYLRVGTEILPNFSAELRAGYGISDDTIAGLERDAQVRGLFGLYLRGGVSLTENLTPYLVAGYARTKVRPLTDITVPGSREETDSDGSLGAGIDYTLSSDWRFNLEYTQYLNKDVHTLSGFSAGFLRYF